MLAHVNNAPKAPSSVKSGLPEALDEVILKALAKDPAQRFQTAAEFAEALGQIERVSKEEPAVKPASIPVSAKAPSPAAMAARAGSSRPATIAATSVLEPPKMKPPAPPAAKAPAEAVAAVRNLGLAAGGGARARQWSMGELILGGVLTSAVLTLVFLAIMTVSGMLHVKPGS